MPTNNTFLPETSYSPEFSALTEVDFQPWRSGLINYQAAGATPETLPVASPGATYSAPSVTYSNPNMGLFNLNNVSEFSGDIFTDAEGFEWVLGPNGQWYSARSDYGKALLGEARMFGEGMYDQSGGYVGSEGLPRDEDAHEKLYPGSRKAANLAGFRNLGATRWNPAYVDYKDAQRAAMGLLPGEEFKSGNWRTTFSRNWQDSSGREGVYPLTPEEINIETELQGWERRR